MAPRPDAGQDNRCRRRTTGALPAPPTRRAASRSIHQPVDPPAGRFTPEPLVKWLEIPRRRERKQIRDITSGQKQSHWMWYIFPQIDGLGFSSMSKRYSIKGLEEARSYLDHPVLGPRLMECAEALVRVQGRTAATILGSPDDLKLRSCATLFACLLPAGSVFDRLLEKYYEGERDGRTLQLLGVQPR